MANVHLRQAGWQAESGYTLWLFLHACAQVAHPRSSFFAPQFPATRSPFLQFPLPLRCFSLFLSLACFLSLFRSSLPRQYSIESSSRSCPGCVHTPRVLPLSAVVTIPPLLLSVAPPLAAAAVAAASAAAASNLSVPPCGSAAPAENSYVASLPRVRSLSCIVGLPLLIDRRSNRSSEQRWPWSGVSTKGKQIEENSDDAGQASQTVGYSRSTLPRGVFPPRSHRACPLRSKRSKCDADPPLDSCARTAALAESFGECLIVGREISRSQVGMRIFVWRHCVSLDGKEATI